MRHWQLALTGVAALLLTACQQAQQPTVQAEQPYQPLTAMDTTPPAEADPYATDPMIAPPETPVAVEPAREAPPAEEETAEIATDNTGVRTHVVQKGDTLYKLARQYYDDQSKWRDIWNANRELIPDPDKLTVGTKLVIP